MYGMAQLLFDNFQEKKTTKIMLKMQFFEFLTSLHHLKKSEKLLIIHLKVVSDIYFFRFGISEIKDQNRGFELSDLPHEGRLVRLVFHESVFRLFRLEEDKWGNETRQILLVLHTKHFSFVNFPIGSGEGEGAF